MKRCFKCGEEKPLDDFYNHPQMADGHLNKCKECTRKDSIQNRSKHIDKYREYDRIRGNRQGPDYIRAYRAQNPEKNRAHGLLAHAVNRGKVNRPPVCQECGRESRVEGHHFDYSKPLDVVWLCSPCHRAKHKIPTENQRQCREGSR